MTMTCVNRYPILIVHDDANCQTFRKSPPETGSATASSLTTGERPKAKDVRLFPNGLQKPCRLEAFTCSCRRDPVAEDKAPASGMHPRGPLDRQSGVVIQKVQTLAHDVS